MAPKFWLGPPNRIHCDAGFWVERVGRDDHRYGEEDRTILVGGEMLMPKGYAVYADSIEKWDPPHDRRRLSHEDRKRIIENVRLALEWVGEPIDVYW